MSIGRQLMFMLNREGIRGCFRGNLVNIAGGVPFGACEFYFYELAKNNLFPNTEKENLSFNQKFVCGGFAGWGAQLLMNPMGVVRTNYTVD